MSLCVYYYCIYLDFSYINTALYVLWIISYLLNSHVMNEWFWKPQVGRQCFRGAYLESVFFNPLSPKGMYWSQINQWIRYVHRFQLIILMKMSTNNPSQMSVILDYSATNKAGLATDWYQSSLWESIQTISYGIPLK